MSRNRYVGDYRIVESIDARGRVKSDYEYIGAPYVYAGDATAVKAARSRVALCCAVGWAAWLSALIPISAAMRALYVALPFAFAAIPLALTAGTGGHCPHRRGRERPARRTAATGRRRIRHLRGGSRGLRHPLPPPVEAAAVYYGSTA